PVASARGPGPLGQVVAPGVQEGVLLPPPHEHVAARPDCGVLGAWAWGASFGGRRPSVAGGAIAAPAVELARRHGETAPAAPDDHLAAGPDGRVVGAGLGRAECRHGRPGVGRGLETRARVVVRRAGPGPAPAAPTRHLA